MIRIPRGNNHLAYIGQVRIIQGESAEEGEVPRLLCDHGTGLYEDTHSDTEWAYKKLG